MARPPTSRSAASIEPSGSQVGFKARVGAVTQSACVCVPTTAVARPSTK